MNSTDNKYSKYALVREMMQTASIVRSYNADAAAEFVSRVKGSKGFFLTGEGSSRIFPAKRAIYTLLKDGFPFIVLTEGSTQAMEYKLDEFAVFAASNSGQTKEVIRLVSHLKNQGHRSLFGITANEKTRLQDIAAATHVLSCGKEEAVAATKSVIEQGLFYHSLFSHLTANKMKGFTEFADKIEIALTTLIPREYIETIKNAEVIYFAGRNNGVAEELALKTNEITRKKSAFLEGTFAVHGIEEVMDKKEVLIWIDPFKAEEEKFYECLVKGVGMNVITITAGSSLFPSIKIPDAGEYNEYVQLAAGWNLLVETGIALGIDLDKPVRARKIGNEFIEG
jgi:glucosamine--fructose-6-phosphate aminotransferase (isomerizing)